MEAAPTEASPTKTAPTKTAAPTHLSALACHAGAVAITETTKGPRSTLVKAPTYLLVKIASRSYPPVELPRHTTVWLDTLSGLSVQAPFLAHVLSGQPL